MRNPTAQGMERAKLLFVCGITIGATVLVIGLTIFFLNMRAVAPGTTDIVVSGKIACLPHKQTGGPQTLECAIGLHTDDNRYFALKNAPTGSATDVGAQVNVRGSLTTGSDGIYDIAGTITVTEVTP